jgi:outer membrane protein TolC
LNSRPVGLWQHTTQISQPLTQLIRIRQENRIAAAEVAISSADVQKAENQVALNVHSLYFGILIARLQKQAAEQQRAYAAEQLRESEEDILKALPSKSQRYKGAPAFSKPSRRYSPQNCSSRI